MRPRQIDSGYVGSLFDEPIKQAMPDGYVTDLYCEKRGEQCPVRVGCVHGLVPCTLKDVAKREPEALALLLDGKWWSAGKMLWDCSDCLCLACANEGKSCHDCKGFEHCKKIGGTGGKIGACPDFRTEEGKEQHCLENGCLCFKCQLIGEQCELCAGPIECEGPTTACHDYVGADTDDVEEETT